MAEPTITHATGAAVRTACADLIATLPGWFGQPEANAAYQREIGCKTCFLAGPPDAPTGLIALEFHFETTAEIWLMAVRAGLHRRGVGHALMRAALDHARQAGARRAMVSTLSPRSPDPGYAATRAFYESQGFQPLVEFNRSDRRNPMMWMDRAL